MRPGFCSPSVRLQPESWALRPGELQSPAAGRRAKRGGPRVTWALGLGGLLLSAAAAARGTGAFCLERRRGAPERRGRRPSPARSVPAAPRGGGGGRPLGRGLISGAPAPPLARPARPVGRNRPGLPARPSYLRSLRRKPLRAVPEAASRPSGRRHEDQGCQETL